MNWSLNSKRNLTSNPARDAAEREHEMALTVERLREITGNVPSSAEVYVIGSDGSVFHLNTVQIEYPGDEDEGEICINIQIDSEDLPQ